MGSANDESINKILKSLPANIDQVEGFSPFNGFTTTAIHVGHKPMQHEAMGHPVIAPISLTTTFQQVEPGVYKYDYSRANNYTREILEQCIAALENGVYCNTYSSGLAVTSAIFQLLSAGDHIIASDDLYGGTNRFIRTVMSRFKIEFTFIEMTDLEKLEAAMRPNTKLIWLETPSNPLMRLIDIEAVAKLAHSKDPNMIVVTDNTFVTPYFQRPLDLGADISMHSLTKYMNGHSDAVMGAAVTRSKSISDRLTFLQLAVGAVPSPFDCYMVHRGIKTLGVRMREHMRNGLVVARFLEGHPLVEKVIHPGLKSHPQYELGQKQMHGYSGMVAAYIRGGREEASRFIKALKLFMLAESLGGFESLIEIPSLMTHMSVPAEQRSVLGITDNLVRFSVGLEDPQDLLNDLDQALKSAIQK